MNEARAFPVAAPPASPEAGRLAVLVLAPVGRDAALAERALGGTGLDVVSLADAAALCDALRRPDVGAVVLTAEALRLRGIDGVSDVLAGEPDWSEVPFVLFVSEGRSAQDYVRAADLLGSHGATTVLDRPIHAVAFRSVVALAVQSRRQQFRVRDLLARVEGFNAELQRRVDEQTAALRRRADEVEALARSLSEAELKERERIAGVLHDDVQQILYGVKIHVGLLGRDDADEVAERIDHYVDEAIVRTRLLATELHPSTLADDGIEAALGWVVDFVSRRHGLTVHLEAIDSPQAPDPETLALVTRVARELLFNVVKHAGVAEAWVRAWCDAEGCHLSVRDEGVGFDVSRPAAQAPTGLGLTDLRHRIGVAGGSLEVASAPDTGTTVTVVLPDG
ncbi:sensor histidine kinase [Rubrivirga sp.]|uniref:sensor histidine kinase n=1 Tax=Rubrivirga sp. TaxID=1885344 RepID=UPI003B52A670